MQELLPLPFATIIAFVCFSCLRKPAFIAAMAALSLAPAAPSLHLATSAIRQSSPRTIAPLLGACGTPRMNVTSLRSQTTLGSSKQSLQRKRWHCRAESVETNETVATGKQEVSQVKESLTEKQGPPVLTILAGLVVAVVVIWGLWSLVSAILGIFFH